jgi:hypothetical protein
MYDGNNRHVFRKHVTCRHVAHNNLAAGYEVREQAAKDMMKE